MVGHSKGVDLIMRDFFIGLLIYMICVPIAVYFWFRKWTKRFIMACQKMGREERLFK